MSFYGKPVCVAVVGHFARLHCTRATLLKPPPGSLRSLYAPLKFSNAGGKEERVRRATHRLYLYDDDARMAKRSATRERDGGGGAGQANVTGSERDCDVVIENKEDEFSSHAA